MQYLKELTSLLGVSGNEHEVREYILDKIKDKCDCISVDTMGNIFAVKRGNGKCQKTVMVAAHMDEVGLICSGITEDGCLKFKSAGGIDPKVLISKRVLAGKNKLLGVIGFKAIHLQSPEERTSPVKMSSLYIDIGAKSKEEALSVISKGDYIAFKSDFRELGEGFIKAKALDDRVGCAAMIKLMDEEFDFDTVFVFTVQEEVGLRGATVAVHRVKPDIALVLETTTCSDVPGVEPKDYSTVSGGGAVLSFMDRSTMYDKELVKLMEKTARENNIPYQFKRTTAGGNDSGAIHTGAAGVRTACISVPTRYIHSPSSVIAKSDYKAVCDLAKYFLKEIGSNA